MKNFRLRVARVRALASLAVSIGLLCSTAAVAADPTVSITGVTFPEGNTGQQISGNVKVRLSAVTDHVVSFHLFTGGGTATSGVDYQPMTGDYVIPAGDIGASFGLSAIGDETPEPDETVNLSISNVVGATVTAGNAVATITNDDGTATPSLSIGDVSIAEGDSGTKTATFTVSLSSAAASTVSFNVATANGTATAGSDYVALASTALSITASGGRALPWRYINTSLDEMRRRRFKPVALPTRSAARVNSRSINRCSSSMGHPFALATSGAPSRSG